MKLPPEFKSILWSYDFDKCDSEEMAKTIICQSISYGDIFHWKWIRSHYSAEKINRILSSVPETMIREKVRPLVDIYFGKVHWNYAPTSTQ